MRLNLIQVLQWKKPPTGQGNCQENQKQFTQAPPRPTGLGYPGVPGEAFSGSVIGERIRYLREKRGFTQQALLEQPSFPQISRRTLIRWEHSGPPLGRIGDVAHFFGLSCGDLHPDLSTPTQFFQAVVEAFHRSNTSA